MTCYHPMRRFLNGQLTKNGKPDGIVVPSTVDFLWKHALTKEEWKKGSFPEKDKKRLINSSDITNYRNSFRSQEIKQGRSVLVDFQEIPCGHCIGCRLSKSKDWAIRCVLESKQYADNCFITLTYNDAHLPPPNPIGDLIVDDDGVVLRSAMSPVHPLRYKDVQDFVKRLRRRLEYRGYKSGKTYTAYSYDDDGNVIGEKEVDIIYRYYGCGEYGPKNMRPHYHMIIFGWKPDDLVPYKRNHMNQPVYTSPYLEKIWGNGFVTVGELTFESAAYTARYVTKKLYGDLSSIYDRLNFPPEFSFMSNTPGIAYQYYSDHDTFLYESDKIYISRGLEKAIVSHPP